MTQKQNDALNEIITALPDDCRENFREIAEYAISLGYMPNIKGCRKDYADFSNSKLKRTILKIKAPDPKFPAAYLEIKFYALPTFTTYFQKAIESRILTWNRLKYDFRCFGCGKCNGTEGYTVTLPDGKKGFLCGFGLLPLPSLSTENIAEVKDAIRMQNDFFTKQATA